MTLQGLRNTQFQDRDMGLVLQG